MNEKTRHTWQVGDIETWRLGTMQTLSIVSEIPKDGVYTLVFEDMSYGEWSGRELEKPVSKDVYE